MTADVVRVLADATLAVTVSFPMVMGITRHSGVAYRTLSDAGCQLLAEEIGRSLNFLQIIH